MPPAFCKSKTQCYYCYKIKTAPTDRVTWCWFACKRDAANRVTWSSTGNSITWLRGPVCGVPLCV